MPGPPTPPAEIVRLKGERNVTSTVRHLAQVVQPVADNPKLPVDLPRELLGRENVGARKWWRRIASSFGSLPVLRHTDYTLLLILVQSLARMERFGRACHAKEVIVVGEGKGEQVVVNPQYQVYVKERSEVIRLLREIGMTPASRTRILADAAAAVESRTSAEIAERKFFGNAVKDVGPGNELRGAD